MTRRSRRFGTPGARSRLTLLHVLRHIASASHRTEAAMVRRWGADAHALLTACMREQWIELHSVATYSYRVTAAGRAALKRLTDSAKQKAA